MAYVLSYMVQSLLLSYVRKYLDCSILRVTSIGLENFAHAMVEVKAKFVD